MRCKPGDLAVVVRAFLPENVGRLVRVVGPPEYPNASGLPSWRVTSAGRPMRGTIGWEAPDVEISCPDAWLRPIRPQPDDATDETLRDVPVTEAA